MVLLYIVLGFLVPVLMVFGYSFWLRRRRRLRRENQAKSDTENKSP